MREQQLGYFTAMCTEQWGLVVLVTYVRIRTVRKQQFDQILPVEARRNGERRLAVVWISVIDVGFIPESGVKISILGLDRFQSVNLAQDVISQIL